MFAYCRNNPIIRRDVDGSDDESAIQEAIQKLYALTDEYAKIYETGFSINIESATNDWNNCLTTIGVDEAYQLMSEYLCNAYYTKYGKEFLFSDSCVANEIEYHVDAYMWTQGYSGYSRNITTLAFSKEQLIEHCKTVEVFTTDVNTLRQRLIFSYKKGIRDCYKGTDEDPFDRRTLWQHMLAPGENRQ